MSEIRDRVEEIRNNREKSQKSFVEPLNISTSKYSKLKNGEQEYTVDILLNIEKKYNVSLIWLMTGQGDMDKSLIVQKDIESLIKYIDVETKNDTLSKHELLNLSLNHLLKKIEQDKGKLRGKNNRVVFLLMELLEQVNSENKEIVDPVGYLENILLSFEEKFISKKKILEKILPSNYRNNSEENTKHLLYQIKRLRHEEADILCRHAEDIILLLNERFTWFEKLFFMKQSIFKENKVCNR